jgi:hypothetical protein
VAREIGLQLLSHPLHPIRQRSAPQLQLDLGRQGLDRLLQLGFRRQRLGCSLDLGAGRLRRWLGFCKPQGSGT